jgi:hypothetical protein
MEILLESQAVSLHLVAVAGTVVTKIVMGYGIVLAILVVVLKCQHLIIGFVLLLRVELSYHLIRIVGKIETSLVLLINIIIKNYQKF